MSNVLILDDDPSSVRMLSRMIEELGYEAIGITHVGEILDAINRATFSAALIDVNLGSGIDGIEAAKGIRGVRPAIKLVVMSGDPTNNDRARAAGFEHFLQKPFSLETLKEAIGFSGPN